MKYSLLLLSVVVLSFTACRKNKVSNSSAAAANQYVAVLKADQYPRYEAIPNLDKSAIPVLMKHVYDSSVIENFPIPAYAAAWYGPQRVGMIIMYTIESIRVQRMHGVSTVPFARDTTASQRTVAVAELAPHYVTWWNKYSDKSAEELKTLSPLEGTTLSWN